MYVLAIHDRTWRFFLHKVGPTIFYAPGLAKAKVFSSRTEAKAMAAWYTNTSVMTYEEAQAVILLERL